MSATTRRSRSDRRASPKPSPRTAGRLWTGLLILALIPFGLACEQRQDPALEGEGEPGEMTPAEERDTLPGAAADTGQQQQQEQQRRTAERATVATATLDGGGAYLTDGTGRALYILQGADDPSACVEECATEWPPFAAMDGEPTTQGQQLQEDLLGTVERPDGSMQVTYDGHPLYFYHDDRSPGDLEGQAVEDQWGMWYLVAPDGQPIEQEQPGTSG